jgi:uncharacterized protein
MHSRRTSSRRPVNGGVDDVYDAAVATPVSFRDRYGPWALIAGASEGIGASFAGQIAESGINVALLARRAEPLQSLADDLRARFDVEVRTATVDLTSASVLDDLAPLVDGIDISLLVYNAGAVHGARFFIERPVDDALQLVNLNCRGPVLLAHRFGRAMASRGRGGMIFMTSMSAASGGAYVATYSATKAFDLVFAESLWMELGQHGVDVLSVVAGLTDTPAMRNSGVLVDGSPFVAMAADDVAAEALAALGNHGPMCVVGDQNREGAKVFWPGSRAEHVAWMSAGAAALYDLPVPNLP